jgi:hypothetical protein
MSRACRTFWVLVGLVGTACQNPSRYRWGGYENSVYKVTANAGEVDAQSEIASISETVERAAELGQFIPPGMHAHLGLLYSLVGDTVNASAALTAEKVLYPESREFIDGVLSRAEASR